MQDLPKFCVRVQQQDCLLQVQYYSRGSSSDFSLSLVKSLTILLCSVHIWLVQFSSASGSFNFQAVNSMINASGIRKVLLHTCRLYVLQVL